MFLRLIVLGIFIVILTIFIKCNLKKSILAYFTLYSLLLAFVSAIVIENGVYISELQMDSYSTGGYIRLFLYFILFIIIFGMSNSKKIEKNIDNNSYNLISKIIYKSIPLVSIFLIIYLYIDMIKVGIPLINPGIPSKYNYFNNITHLPFISILFKCFTFYVPCIFGVIFDSIKNKKTKIIIILSELLMCLYMILIGYKVSGMRNVLLGFLIPILYLKSIRGEVRFEWKLVKKIIKISTIFLVILAINYSVFSDGLTIREKIKSRTFALTSHIWWVTDAYREKTDISIDEVINNFEQNVGFIIRGESVYSTNIGVAKLMNKFAPSIITEYYLSNNVRMGASFITVSIYEYGYIITIFIIIICALIYSKLLIQFGKGLETGDAIEIILYNRLIIYFETYLWATGTITEFINTESIIIICFLIFYKILKKGKLKNEKDII